MICYYQCNATNEIASLLNLRSRSVCPYDQIPLELSLIAHIFSRQSIKPSAISAFGFLYTTQIQNDLWDSYIKSMVIIFEDLSQMHTLLVRQGSIRG
jgi:hypothetical protein